MLRSAIFFSAIFAISCSADALEISCPEKIVTTQKLVGRAKGWKEFVRPDGTLSRRNYSYVSGIGIYDGDPREIVELKPDDEMAKEETWSFNKPTSSKRPLYMACAYFETRVQFIRTLPPSVKKCTSKRGVVLQCEEF